VQRCLLSLIPNRHNCFPSVLNTLLVEYEKSPADGLKIQLKFYEEVRSKWKLKYKNNDRFERQFFSYAKGESNIRW
jgi:hypothetical protein